MWYWRKKREKNTQAVNIYLCTLININGLFLSSCPSVFDFLAYHHKQNMFVQKVTDTSEVFENAAHYSHSPNSPTT